jgi:hypothetical protein
MSVDLDLGFCYVVITERNERNNTNDDDDDFGIYHAGLKHPHTS